MSPARKDPEALKSDAAKLIDARSEEIGRAHV
jgi:hypothetical protein